MGADDTVKGFEVDEGRCVVLDHEEIKAAAGDRGRVIELSQFVDASEIDPVFYEKTYFVGSRDEPDAYRSLREALAASGRARVGRFTFHYREYLAAAARLTTCARCTRCALSTRSSRRTSSTSGAYRSARPSRRSRWLASSSSPGPRPT